MFTHRFTGSPLGQLSAAIIRGDIKKVKSLLKEGARVDIEVRNFTPLMWAVYHQHLNILATLLEFKADINQTNKCGDTALSIAVQNGPINVVKSLLEYKADINVGSTPELHVAALHDRKEIAIVLLKEYKVDINQKDNEGETALMKAAYCGKLNVTHVLLASKDIDIYCKNKHGKTARDIAANENHPAIIKALDDFIAFKEQQNILVFGLFGSGQSSLKTLSSDCLFDSNAVKIISELLKPKSL